MDYIVGVDIGGTFTDCVVGADDGTIIIGKAPSTPEDFSIGVIDAMREAAKNLGLDGEDQLLQATSRFLHGCTIGENTLITRSGAQTGLIATKGFADSLPMMRAKIREGLTETEAANLTAITKPEPFVQRQLIREVTERIDYKGAILIRLDLDEAERVLEELIEKGVESIAVSLLWSVANDTHERAVAGVLKEKHPSIHVSISSEMAPFIGEYERTATTVFNAYIAPKMGTYLQSLQTALNQKGLTRDPLIMQAYGGVIGTEAARKNAVGTIESGPAAGVVGSKFLGDLIGEPNILAADMGGTTFKVSVIRDGVIERDYNPVFLRYSILSPKIWVESIGAGGGSIAWVDPETGLLKVGPQGAGARPGPVCYGFGGTEPTISDADLLLGYLNEDYFLGGRMPLNKDAAVEAIRETVAKPLGISETEAARGICAIANAHMSDLIRKATVERGHNPANFVLFAFGGAGPVHAGRYAAELGIKKILIPSTASVHGATGLISSDVVFQYGKSDHLLVPPDITRVNENFSALCAKALDDLHRAGFADEDIQIIRSLDMRYRFLVHERSVPLPEVVSEITQRDMEELYVRFDEFYEMAYGRGSGYPQAGRDIITFRVDAIGRLRKPNIKTERLQSTDPGSAHKAKRSVYFDEHRGFIPTDVYGFERMTPGMQVEGPAVIETPVTTIVSPTL